jgi:hypothetical protein
MVLLLRFLARQRDKPITGLDLTDLDPPGILAFLAHLEQERNNSASTRNVRLSAIHAFFHFVAARNPEHLALERLRKGAAAGGAAARRMWIRRD